EFGATHIVVFYTFHPADPQQEWRVGDNVKWTWMVEIGGLNISDYLNEEVGITERYYGSTLYTLMKLQPGPGFTLAFASDFRYVLVYEIDYEAGV
ncbi:MAG: hypothetical protein JSV18_05895, partial [Candidatus Bathyarchaeota archaeon]